MKATLPSTRPAMSCRPFHETSAPVQALHSHQVEPHADQLLSVRQELVDCFGRRGSPPSGPDRGPPTAPEQNRGRVVYGSRALVAVASKSKKKRLSAKRQPLSVLTSRSRYRPILVGPETGAGPSTGPS